MASTTAGMTPSLLATPIITSGKLNWKNYSSWSASVELWFLGQGYHGHLEKEVSTISEEKKPKW